MLWTPLVMACLVRAQGIGFYTSLVGVLPKDPGPYHDVSQLRHLIYLCDCALLLNAPLLLKAEVAVLQVLEVCSQQSNL